jgi:hypothetical protein
MKLLLLTGAALCLLTVNAKAGDSEAGDAVQRLELTPSSAALAACMPYAKLDVTVKFTTAEVGFDRFHIPARNLPPNRDFTVFLLEQ